MAGVTTAAQGSFVWHDLMTTDVEAAQAFYTGLFGWTVTHLHDLHYNMIRNGDRDQGGFVRLDQAQVPSHWIAYVLTDDVAACGARAKRLGGALCVPPTEIPGMGKFAVVTDRQQAVSSPWQAFDPIPAPPETPAAGAFCWVELLTSDPDDAKAFYADVYGWSFTEMDMGAMGVYHLIRAGDRDVGGMLKMPAQAGDAPAHFLPYVAVDDVDACVEKSEELGGTIFVVPTEIPEIGRFAVMQDPTGAMFAVYRSAAKSA